MSPPISASIQISWPLPTKKLPKLAPKDDTKQTAHPPCIRKRLSTRCLRAIHKLRPHSIFSSDHLSTPSTNSRGVLTLTRCPSCSGSSISPRTSVFPTALDGDTISPNIAEAHDDFESPENHVIRSPNTPSNPKSSPDLPCSNNPPPRGKGPRLVVWKHKKFDSFNSGKTKFEHQLGLGKKGVATTPQKSDEINLEIAKLKKSRSVLFRFWSSTTPGQAPEVNQIQHQQAGDIPDQQTLSHPLKIHFTEAAKDKKDRERVPQQDGLHSSQLGGTGVGDSLEPDTAVGRRCETDKFGGVGRGLNQEIGQGGISIHGSLIHSLVSVKSTTSSSRNLAEYSSQTFCNPGEPKSVILYCLQMFSQFHTRPWGLADDWA